MEVLTKSAKETRELGKKIAGSLKVKGAKVFALTGELGSGKTTFVQGMAQGLGIDKRILSPTYVLIRQYKITPATSHQPPATSFYHVDLYRLETDIEKELKNLGLDDIWQNSENIVAVEWAEKVTGMFPKNVVWIKFEDLGGDKRKITINH